MTESKRSRGRAIAIVAVLAVAAGAGVLIERSLRKAPPATEPVVSSEPAPAGAVPADQPTAEAPPAKVVPDVLPQIEVPDRDGKPRRLGEWAGRPLIVNYWATWCAPCVREIPLLNSLRREYASSRLEIIGIAVDFRDEVLAFQTPMDYPVLIGDVDSPQVVAAVGMDPTLPFTVFADSQQRIVALKIGELHHDEAELILSRILRLDAGELELPAAREQISEGLKTLAQRRAGATG
jgi:thiol-disulfide isomerase/thioredoxin